VGRSFQEVHQVTLPKITSDHFPIFLRVGEVSRGRHPFKFENMWLEADGFDDLVKSIWDELNVIGPSSFILAKKLNFLKTKLKQWNREVFGHLEFKMASLVDKVKLLDEKEQQQSLSWADRYKRLRVKKELSMVRKSIDIFWRQRAKQQWSEDGDRNTKFFHQVANIRKRFNAIHKIQVDGEFYFDAASAKNATFNFYENLYHED